MLTFASGWWWRLAKVPFSGSWRTTCWPDPAWHPWFGAVTPVALLWRRPSIRPTWSGAALPCRALGACLRPKGSSRHRNHPIHLPPSAPGQIKPDTRQTVSMLKGGKKLCKAFNDQRGCKGDCGALHACDVRLPSGQACQATSHNRQSHPE